MKMKTNIKLTITTIVMIIITSINVFADSRYEAGMQKGIGMLENANTPDAAIEAANYFERIAEANSSEWLPLYYAAYASLKSGYLNENMTAKDDWYQKGLAFTERAEKIKQNESEILAMEGLRSPDARPSETKLLSAFSLASSRVIAGASRRRAYSASRSSFQRLVSKITARAVFSRCGAAASDSVKPPGRDRMTLSADNSALMSSANGCTARSVHRCEPGWIMWETYCAVRTKCLRSGITCCATASSR